VAGALAWAAVSAAALAAEMAAALAGVEVTVLALAAERAAVLVEKMALGRMAAKVALDEAVAWAAPVLALA